MLKGLFTGFLGVLLVAGIGYATPEIPEGYEMQGQAPIQCGDTLILVYGFQHLDGSVIKVFKEPNKPIRVYLRWAPGSDNQADEIWVGNKQMTYEELVSKYPYPCAVFLEKEA